MRFPSKKQFIAKIKKLDLCADGMKRLKSKLRHNTVREVIEQYLNIAASRSALSGVGWERYTDIYWLLGRLNFSFDDTQDLRAGIKNITSVQVIQNLNYWT